VAKKKINNYEVYIIGEIKSHDFNVCKERFLQAKILLKN
jgi:hypothetical protein